MTSAGELATGATPDVARPPEPVPLEQALAGWSACAADPELACAGEWSALCAAWWDDPDDDRLRARALEDLRLAPDELAEWLECVLDADTLVRAHAHVTAMRAALERDPSRRRLTSGALRSVAVAAKHRGGGRTYFVPAADVAERIAALAPVLGELPSHPFARAAWIAQSVGAIHPFSDNNGGTLRFLASLELARARFPGLRLSPAQRNGTYIDGLMHANRTGDLGPLAHVVAATVQAGLATTLLTQPRPIAWDADLSARASHRETIVDGAWRRAVGDLAVVREDLPPARARAQAVRRGMQLPRRGALRSTRWTLHAPIPVHLDLTLTPVRGGPTTWTVATLAIGLGDGPMLAAHLPGVAVPVYFVSPAVAPSDHEDARYERWVSTRIAQCLQGIARWL